MLAQQLRLFSKLPPMWAAPCIAATLVPPGPVADAKGVKTDLQHGAGARCTQPCALVATVCCGLEELAARCGVEAIADQLEAADRRTRARGGSVQRRHRSNTTARVATSYGTSQ
eukprot:SAG11_NODE_1001_length_6220_cov_6.550400_9_plen_114_part_00